MEFFTIKKEYFKPFSVEDGNLTYITFRYMLPFRLPLKVADSFVIDDTMFIPLHRQYEHYGLKDGMVKLPIRRTIIEATVKVSKKTKREILKELENSRESKKSKKLSKVFDKQLEKLNDFIEIIIMKYGILTISQVHKGEVIGFAYYKMYGYGNGKITSEEDLGILMLHNTLEAGYGDYKTLKDMEVKEIMDKYYNYKSHSYKNIVISARKGEKALNLFDFNSAIVHFNTMFELLISTIVRDYYLILNLKTREKVNNIISNSVKHIATQHLYKCISELELTNTSEIENLIESYLENEYSFRNEILHEGKNFGEEEAYQTMFKVKDLSYLLNHNINNADSNEFVDYYRKHNSSNFPDLYDDIVQKYKT